MREKVLAALPGCTLHYTLEHKASGIISYVEGKRFRKKRYPPHKFRPLISETRANLKELLKYHADLHHGHLGEKLSEAVIEKEEIPLHFYVDGVSPSTTGSMKMICEVVRHSCCNLIMNYNTIIYAKDYDITPQDLLQGLLRDLNRWPFLKIKLVICDMPERLRLCGLTSCNGFYGCLHCFAKGSLRSKGPGVVWPSDTLNANPRDDKCFRDMSEAAQRTGEPCGGLKSLSPLMHITDFSIVESVPVDPMHMVSGLVKFFWERLPAQCKMSKAQVLALTKTISDSYCQMSLPSDFKRKPRPIDPPKFRCNEWKQLLCLRGIAIGDEYIDYGFPDVGALWHRLTWIIRVMAQGDRWYEHATCHGEILKMEIKKLYEQVEELMGKDNCVPNLHALSHMPYWRAKHRLGVITTERAEAFYGINRRSFAEQAASIGKQVMLIILNAMASSNSCLLCM